jgi:8-hydroxy-5-deazaflavin:NADPH oxidoreductase
MQIGILGSGLMGGKPGTLFGRTRHVVVFSNSHKRSKLESLARAAGKTARAGTPREAAQDADVLLLALHWNRVDDVLRQAGNLSSKVLVICTLPMNRDVGFDPVDAGPLQVARYIEPFALLVAKLQPPLQAFARSACAMMQPGPAQLLLPGPIHARS